MSAHVISHRKPRRKRGRVMAWAMRRFGALAIAILGLIVASFIAPLFTMAPTRSAPPPALPIRTQDPVAPPAWPELADVDIRLDLAGLPEPQPAPPRGRRGGVRLDAAAPHVGEDFEVLSAAELDAISQARH